MASVNFPASPAIGQTYTFSGRTWTWNGIGWVLSGGAGGGGGASMVVGPTPPASPIEGQEWLDETSGILYVWYTGTTSNAWIEAGPISSGSNIPPPILNYLGGLTLANDAGQPLTVLNIASGCACSDDGTMMMTLPATFVKSAAAAWSPGSNAGMLDTGALAASTWYHLFAIGRPDIGLADVLMSTSVSAPVMPANYTKKRRIGSIKTNASSQIIAFTQYGDQFLWVTLIADYFNAGIAAGIGNAVVTVPTGVNVIGLFSALFVASTAATIVIQSPAHTSGYNSPAGNQNLSSVPQGTYGAGDYQIRTNTAAQISIGAQNAVNGLYFITRGWIDNRGK